MSRLIDLTGETYGRLTVLEYVGRKNRRSYWKCKCSCGNVVEVSANNMRNGHTQSCGCYAREENKRSATKHNLSGTALYRAWTNMVTRATNPKFIEAHRYIERGITICDEWKNSSSAFFTWALSHGYKEGLTLDRIDNSKGYYPDNCRWVNRITQCRNKDNNVWIEYQGQRKILVEWVELLGLDYKRTHDRLRRGWDIERAFTTP